MTAPWIIAYAVGYAIWLGYATNRFCLTEADGSPMFEEIVIFALVALLWPVCVAVYLPYRIFRWAGVRRG
jgi:hypothetical protein